MGDFVGECVLRIRRGKRCRCDWCNGWIEQFDTYATWGQVWEGDFSQIRMHADCFADGYKKLKWSDYDDGYPLGDMVRGQPIHKDQLPTSSR